jgi:hypothetical protein
MITVWLRLIDAGTDNACWVVCARGDPGAAEFAPKNLQLIDLDKTTYLKAVPPSPNSRLPEPPMEED